MCPNTPTIMRAAQQVALIAQARAMLRSNAGSRPTFAIPMHQASRNASCIRETRPPPTLTYACEYATVLASAPARIDRPTGNM